ncbi:MAG: tetratricopeptide repeat protein [Myxococcota bacterium]
MSQAPKPPAKPPTKPPAKPPKKPEVQHSEPPRSTLDPSVLVVGADDVFLPALKLALARHRVHVESTTLDQAVETVVVAAPDLILLAGEAARDTGHGLLAKLTSSPVSSVIPVVLLGDDPALASRLRAFRHGATAVIPRSASIDAVAETIGKLAREIPERGGNVLGEVGEATLEEFVNALTTELRSGILSVEAGAEKTPVRLVLGSGRPLAAFIDEFVRRARHHVVRAEPLRYEFDDRAGGTVQLLPEETPGSEPPPRNIQKLRLLLADSNPARADVVAQELRSRGAEVVVSALDPSEPELARVRQLDPEVVVIGEKELEGPGYALLRRMKRDTRLRWASLLVVRWEEISGPSLGVPAVDRLTGPLATLAEADRGLCDRAELGDAFDARLEVNGPARCLRALAASGRSLRVSVHNARINVDIDISDGLLVGATARTPSGEHWEGAPALSALLVVSSGRVHVEPTLQPATTNLMSEVDAALNLAEKEHAPIAPSLPAGSISGAPPQPEAPPMAVIPRAAPLPREFPVDPLAQTAPALDLEPYVAPAPPAPEPMAAAQPSPFTSRPSRPATLIDSFPKLEAAARLSQHPRFRVKGISPPLAALFVGAAIVQGLLAAGIYKYVHRSRANAPVVAASAVSSAANTAPVAAPPASGATASPAPSAIASNGATSALPQDESGKPAPSCEDLLGDSTAASGDNVGAAFEQLKLARKALVQGKSDDAQRAYCKAVRWDSNNAAYHFELAQLLLIRRDGAAAAEWARRGVRLEPGSTRGQALVGDALARVGDEDGARRAWFAAASANNPSAEEIQGLYLRAMKEAEQALSARDYMRAERFFRRGVILDHSSANAHRGLAMALLRIGEANNALAWARKSNELAPGDPAVKLTLGDALLASGDAEGARNAWLEAERLGYPDARRRLSHLDRAP